MVKALILLFQWKGNHKTIVAQWVAITNAWAPRVYVRGFYVKQFCDLKSRSQTAINIAIGLMTVNKDAPLAHAWINYIYNRL